MQGRAAMAHSLIHALSACMALAGYHADNGLEEPIWKRPIAEAAVDAIERGDVDAETFDACVVAVRNEIDRDAALGRSQTLENVYGRCEALAKELSGQELEGERLAC
jgi:hypothetical protein